MVDGLTVSRGSLILGQLAVCLLFYIGGFGVELFRRPDSVRGYWVHRVVGLWTVCPHDMWIDERTCCDKTGQDESFCPALYNAQGFVFGSVLPCSFAVALLLHRQLGRRLPRGVKTMRIVMGLNIVAVIFGLATTTQLWALWQNKDFKMVERERAFHLTMIGSILSVPLIAWDAIMMVLDDAEGPDQNPLRAFRMGAGYLVGLLCFLCVGAFIGLLVTFMVIGFRTQTNAYPAWVLVDFLGMFVCVMCILCLMFALKCREPEAEPEAEAPLPTQQQLQVDRYQALLDVRHIDVAV
jgi:hypothetical protein